MKFKKLAFGLSLTAAFGLMACGDDSSTSAATGNNSLDNSCKATISGKTASYTRVQAGTISVTQSVTVNADGTESWSFKQTYPKNTFTAAEQDAYCSVAKAEVIADNQEDADAALNSFKCSDGNISAEWTAKPDGEDKLTADQYKQVFDYICNPFDNEAPDFWGGDDDDDDSDDDSDETSDSESGESSSDSDVEGGSDDGNPVRSYKCDISMDSDTWTVTVSSETEIVMKYVFEGSDVTKSEKMTYSVGSASACSAYLGMEGDGEGTSSCDGKMLTISYEPEVMKNVDKSVLYESVKYDCDLMASLYQ